MVRHLKSKEVRKNPHKVIIISIAVIAPFENLGQTECSDSSDHNGNVPSVPGFCCPRFLSGFSTYDYENAWEIASSEVHSAARRWHNSSHTQVLHDLAEVVERVKERVND
jgi:hypothetical protein